MGKKATIVEVRTPADLAEIKERLCHAASQFSETMRQCPDEGLLLLRRMKFEKFGCCPFNGDGMNVIEQVNQTFTTLATLRATRILMERHPDADGFRLALGWATGYDIVSVKQDLVAAEVFCAMSPQSNNKLRDDARKVSRSSAQFKYVFFHVPGRGEEQVEDRKDAPGVHVWSVALE